jgi:hypothetical protein
MKEQKKERRKDGKKERTKTRLDKHAYKNRN